MIAGLVAALALASSPVQAVSIAAASAPQTEAPAAAADPIGDIIQTVSGAVSQAVDQVEQQVKATLYHAAIKGMSRKDSLGCKLVPMRTVAVDPKVTPRHSILFIKATVGMKMPDGSVHDGYWYASDVGGAIKGQRIDLFTGMTAASMQAFRALNLTTISAVKVGVFDGCPTAKPPASATVQVASRN